MLKLKVHVALYAQEKYIVVELHEVNKILM